MDVEVLVLPEPSLAIAVRVCAPLLPAWVSQGTEYGAVVSGEPIVVPSTLNVTLATATLSLALAVTLVVPTTVAPASGAVIDTVGAVESVVAVADASAVAGPTVPAASRARAPEYPGPPAGPGAGYDVPVGWA